MKSTLISLIPLVVFSKLAASPVPIVTDCPECDSVEECTCSTKGNSTVPFKMIRNHGIVAIPQFDLGGEGAVTEWGDELKIIIMKFRSADGALLPDKSFSYDGMEELSLPLTAEDRVAEYTLTKSKLVVLSHPENYQGLSRVTTISLNDTGNLEGVDDGYVPELLVKGELFRYHNETLYTFSPEENMVFIYPQGESDSDLPHAPSRAVDLSSVRLSGEQLVSFVADDNHSYAAVRKEGSESDNLSINVYKLNYFEEFLNEEETIITGADQQFQLYLLDGKPVLKLVTSDCSAMDALTCSGNEVALIKRKRSLDGDPDYGSGFKLYDNGTDGLSDSAAAAVGFIMTLATVGAIVTLCVCCCKKGCPCNTLGSTVVSYIGGVVDYIFCCGGSCEENGGRGYVPDSNTESYWRLQYNYQQDRYYQRQEEHLRAMRQQTHDNNMRFWQHH